MSEKYEIKQVGGVSIILRNGDYVGEFLNYQDAVAFIAGAKAIDLLKRIEWSGDTYEPLCPMCKRNLHDGHAADCELAALIASSPSEAKP